MIQRRPNGTWGPLLALGLVACGGQAPPPEPASALAPTSGSEPVAAADTAPAPEDSALSAPQAQGPTHSLFLIGKVKDPDALVAHLSGTEDERVQAGIRAHVVSKVEGSDQVVIHFLARDRAKLQALVDAKKEATLKGHPDLVIVYAEDVEYRTPDAWPETTYSVYYRFEVDDFPHWKQYFDQGDVFRKKVGVVAHGVHRSEDDRQVIVHYVAESLTTIKQLVSQPEMKQVLKEAGVKGNPKPIYAKNVEMKRYAAP
jgi:hypothetical protein